MKERLNSMTFAWIVSLSLVLFTSCLTYWHVYFFHCKIKLSYIHISVNLCMKPHESITFCRLWRAVYSSVTDINIRTCCISDIKFKCKPFMCLCETDVSLWCFYLNFFLTGSIHYWSQKAWAGANIPGQIGVHLSALSRALFTQFWLKDWNDICVKVHLQSKISS